MDKQDLQEFKELLLASNNSVLNAIRTSLISDKSEDHDLLIGIKTQVENIIKDIKDIKDGTARRIECLELKTDNLEKWQVAQLQDNKNSKNYIRFVVGLGLLILSIFLWHIYGYKI